MAKPAVYFLPLLLMMTVVESSDDTNHAYTPCSDTTVQLSDGFTFGIAFASRQSFVFNSSLQLSPCDGRLSLSNSNSPVALFRPKVDEISLLTINTSSFSPVSPSPILSLFPFLFNNFKNLSTMKIMKLWDLGIQYPWII